MSLQPAEQVGDTQDWINLDDLVAVDGRVLLVARIREYLAADPNDFGGVNWPVTADLLVCSGSRSGEVEEGKRFIKGAQTRTLRGVPAPKPGELAQPPKNPVGAEIGIRAEFKQYKKEGGEKGVYVAFNPPTPGEFAQIQAVYASGQGWANAEAAEARNTAALQVSAPAPVSNQLNAVQAAPAQSAAPSAEQLAQFAAWQAQQAAELAEKPAAPVADLPAGPPAAAPWRVAG